MQDWNIPSSIRFFDEADIDRLLAAAGIEPPPNLHYAAKRDMDALPGVHADSLAERAAYCLHSGLYNYILEKRRLELAVTHKQLAAWSKRVRRHTCAALEELGFVDTGFSWQPSDSRVSRLAFAAGARREQIYEKAGEAANQAFGPPRSLRARPARSGRPASPPSMRRTIDGEEAYLAVQALQVLDALAEQAALYHGGMAGRTGPKGALNIFFEAIMAAHQLLTGRAVTIVARDGYSGTGLAFTTAALGLAAERVEQRFGSLRGTAEVSQQHEPTKLVERAEPVGMASTEEAVLIEDVETTSRRREFASKCGRALRQARTPAGIAQRIKRLKAQLPASPD